MGRGQEWHPQGQSSKAKVLGRLHPGRSQEERCAPNTGTECVHGVESDAGGCDMTDPPNLHQRGWHLACVGYAGPGSRLPLLQALPASRKGRRAKERLQRALDLAGFSRKAGWL